MLLGGIAVFDREDSFGERSERIGSLELALRIGPKSLTENSGVGVPEYPIRVIQHAAKAHGPLDKIVALGEASMEAIERVGDKIHFARKPTQIRTRPDEVKIEIADRRAMPSRGRTSEGHGRRPYICRATKHLRRDRLQRIGLKEERPLSIVAKTILPAKLLVEVKHRTTPPLPR